MAALFPPWTNTALPLGAAAIVAAGAVGIAAPMIYVRMPYSTEQLTPVEQPVEFDHRHHVGDAQIDCIYCHASAEVSPSAGVPDTETCMGCHSQVWPESVLLEPVRRSYFSGKPIPWRRVHRLPEFVYFDHSVHVQYEIDCATCHGAVEQMARVYQVAPLTMGWCLECHRDPESYLAKRASGPLEHDTTWSAAIANMTPEIATRRRSVDRLTTCTACHR